MTHQERLIAALQRSAPYPHSVGPVSVRETHISWVFLTGDFAYKVKKPVRTSFLDFSTLSRRQAACQDELRLNRRFAPTLYLDVLPITGTADAPIIGGSGEAFECTLQMRQFPESAVLSHLASEHRLTTSHIDELAQVLGSFHLAAEQCLVEPPWGRPELVLREADENLLVLESADLSGVRNELSQLRNWTTSAARRLERVFDARRNAGFVRECHGDLHLGNLVIWNSEDPLAAPGTGRVTPFDGIEFNPEYRWIDIISDIAFAVMDLADRDCPRLAHRLLNAWLEQTGDYAGLAVLNWYLVYRSLVRAKVAVIRARQQTLDEAGRESQRREAEQYVRLATSYVHPDPPRLYITCGVSGSGKTTGTQSLVDDAGMIRIRSDIERKRRAGLSSTDRRPAALEAGLYSSESTNRTYQSLAELADAILLSGHSVVVDATFLRGVQRHQFRELAGRHQAEFRIVPFDADAETLRRRIFARQQADQDASDAGLQVLGWQLQHREPLSAEEQRLVVDPDGRPPHEC